MHAHCMKSTSMNDAASVVLIQYRTSACMRAPSSGGRHAPAPSGPAAVHAPMRWTGDLHEAQVLGVILE